MTTKDAPRALSRNQPPDMRAQWRAAWSTWRTDRWGVSQGLIGPHDVRPVPRAWLQAIHMASCPMPSVEALIVRSIHTGPPAKRCRHSLLQLARYGF